MIQNEVLEKIAKSSSYGLEEVCAVFDHYKSYDRVVEACEFGSLHGYGSLMQAARDCRQEKVFPGISDFLHEVREPLSVNISVSENVGKKVENILCIHGPKIIHIILDEDLPPDTLFLLSDSDWAVLKNLKKET